MAVGVASCNSDDPCDATSKHVYGEGEAPYLRTNNAATNAVSFEIPIARINEPVHVYFKDYAKSFHHNLDLTVDEALAGVDNGELVIYNINSGRQCWILNEPNDADNCWYYTAAGNITEDPTTASFSAKFLRQEKCFEICALNNPPAGTQAKLDLGFAIKSGTDFDDYVRFTINIVITDPSMINVSGKIPAGDYNSYTLKFADYDSQIQTAFGMTAKEFIKLIDSIDEYEQEIADQPVQVFLMKNGERVTDENGLRPETTTNAFGWWLDADLNIRSWGEGCFLFLEYGGGGQYNFGRYPGVASGTQTLVIVDFALTEDLNKHITFMVSLTFE